MGTTPTTHILKPQLGHIPTAFGPIDMADSVDNEHYCLKLLKAFGLEVAKTKIATFGQRRVLSWNVSTGAGEARIKSYASRRRTAAKRWEVLLRKSTRILAGQA